MAKRRAAWKSAKIIFILAALALPAAGNVRASGNADPGKADQIIMDSLTAGAGESVVMTIGVVADDSTEIAGNKWVGVGTICIPINYDKNAMAVDSIKYTGTMANWDEHFANKKIDSGFVSINGIHDIGGKENPLLFSPDKREEIIRLYLSIKKDAKPGIYTFELTKDPIQGEYYLASGDGVTSWKPLFRPGKILIK